MADDTYQCDTGKRIAAGLFLSSLSAGLVNGIWTWFTDPRAVYRNGTTYFGWIDSTGSTGVTKYTHATGGVESFTLSASLQTDDHNNVAIHFLSDGRLVCYYSKHNDSSGLRYRISVSAEDVSAFDAEVVVSGGVSLPVTYANPLRLSADPLGREWLFYRSGGGGATTSRMAYITSTDMASWSAQVGVWEGSGNTPYYKIKSDGESRIHFAATNFHPVQGQSSLYHFYADVSPADGSITWHQSDGASILGALPHYTADATQVYDGSTVRCWVWDIAIDGAGNPRILGTRYPNNDGTDIRYMSWTWNGSTWVEAEITTDGQGLYSGEIYYAGGLCFDAADPNYVYLSAPVAGVREIQKWRTTDNGLSWTKVEDITSGSVGVLNARPYSPRAGEVLFWSGAYTTFTSYNTAVKRYGA